MFEIHPVTLEGDLIRLETLHQRHYSDLIAGMDADTFRNYPWPPVGDSKDAFRRFLDDFPRLPERLTLVAIDRATGQAVGSSSMYDFRPRDSGLEIGYTWLNAAYRGTAFNPEMKLLMFAYAFETLGCVRVQLKTDARNARSLAAMRRLGFTEEGTLRRHLLTHEGVHRDTVFFSVIAEEWPSVKVSLTQRIMDLSRS